MPARLLTLPLPAPSRGTRPDGSRRRGRLGPLGALVAGAVLVAGCLGPAGSRSFDLVNAERAGAGRAALHNHPDLNRKAQGWADELARRGALAHSDLAAGVPAGWSALAENVGAGSSVDDVHHRLMASSVHRANLLDGRFTHVGIGTATSADGRLFVVQVYMG